MINLPEETLRRNTALAGTYGKGYKTRNDRIGSWGLKWSNVLEWRKIVKLHILLCLFQEKFDASLKLSGMKMLVF